MSLVSWCGKSEGLGMAAKRVFCHRYRSDGVIRVHLKPSAGFNLEEKDVLRFQGGEDAN